MNFAPDRRASPGGPGHGVLGGAMVGTGIPADDSGWALILDASWPWPVVVEIVATGPAPAASHLWELRIRTVTGLAGPTIVDQQMATRASYRLPSSHLSVEARALAGAIVAVACAPTGQP